MDWEKDMYNFKGEWCKWICKIYFSMWHGCAFQQALVDVQNVEQLHAHDCHQSVTEHVQLPQNSRSTAFILGICCNSVTDKG